jgi:hypothetical protein
MYYPEGNCLVGLENFDQESGTPSYKSVPVALRASTRTNVPLDV